MDETIRKIAVSYASEVQDEEESLLKELGKIPAPSHQEDKRAAFVRDWMLAHGAADVTIDEAKNVICRVNCTADNPLTVFAAHTDVVFPDTEPLPMHQEGRRLFAPGIGDDTSNLCNLLMTLKYVLEHRLTSETGMLFVANACEEGLGNLDGTKALFAAYGRRIRNFYSFDGYLGQCTSVAVGSNRYRVSVHVRGGHSYLDFGRANAIEIMSRIIGQLYQVKPPTEEVTTYNVGRIEGGSTVNSIAEDCSMLFEFRSSSQKCLREMETIFNRIIAENKGDDRELKVEILGIRPGTGEFPEQVLETYTQKTAETIAAFYHGKMDLGPYSTDANIPLSQGIPGNTIGTVAGKLAHTREEWVDLDSLQTGLQIAMGLVLSHMNA